MREIQHLTRLYVAWLFVCAEETKLKSADNLKVMQDNVAKMQASMAENEHMVQDLSTQIQELQKKKDQVWWRMNIVLEKISVPCKLYLGNIMSILNTMIVMSCLGGERGFKIPWGGSGRCATRWCQSSECTWREKTECQRWNQEEEGACQKYGGGKWWNICVTFNDLCCCEYKYFKPFFFCV